VKKQVLQAVKTHTRKQSQCSKLIENTARKLYLIQNGDWRQGTMTGVQAGLLK